LSKQSDLNDPEYVYSAFAMLGTDAKCVLTFRHPSTASAEYPQACTTLLSVIAFEDI